MMKHMFQTIGKKTYDGTNNKYVVWLFTSHAIRLLNPQIYLQKQAYI